jgi:flagellar export protein FliJ
MLDLKKRAEDEIKKEVARKNGQIIVGRREHEELLAQLKAFFIEEKQQRLRLLDLLKIRYSLAFRGQLQKDIVQKEKSIQVLIAELDKLRVRLAQARKECRVLEILKEKKFSRWKKEYKKEEQEFIDDVSQKGYVRRLHSAEAHTS